MEEFSVPVRTQTDEEGREETVLQNNVLPNVYDDWSEDQDGNRTPVDRTAEYDKLLTRYIEDRTLYEHNLIDTGYNDYIIEVFTGATASSPSGVQQQLQEEIASLAERISSLQDIYYETNDEYNEYLGAQNIMMLSSVRVTERFPILIFAVLIMGSLARWAAPGRPSLAGSRTSSSSTPLPTRWTDCHPGPGPGPADGVAAYAAAGAGGAADRPLRRPIATIKIVDTHLDGSFPSCLCPKNLKAIKASCVFGASAAEKAPRPAVCRQF